MNLNSDGPEATDGGRQVGPDSVFSGALGSKDVAPSSSPVQGVNHKAGSETIPSPAGASEGPRPPTTKPLFMDGNGRIVCADLRCAGSAAHFSGMKVDLHGARITRVKLRDVQEWATYGLGPMKCESCGAEASVLEASRG